MAYGFASSRVGGAIMRALIAEAAGNDAARGMIHERFVAKRRALRAETIVRETGRAPDAAMLLTELAFGLMWSRRALDADGSAGDVERVLTLRGLGP